MEARCVFWKIDDSLKIDGLEKFLRDNGNSIKFVSEDKGLVSPPRNSLLPEISVYQPEISVHHIEPPGVTLTYIKSRLATPAKSYSVNIIFLGEENKIKELEAKVYDILGIKEDIKSLVVSVDRDYHIGTAYPKPIGEK